MLKIVKTIILLTVNVNTTCFANNDFANYN